MREIKFRAWDSKNDIMRDWDYIRTEWTLTILNGDHNTEIMQYTGLKDKNSKEVFEGDVFEWRPKKGDTCIQSNFDPLPLRKVVYWNTEDAEWNMKNYEMEPCHSGFTFSKKNLETMAEIIGNIHENPELLKS